MLSKHKRFTLQNITGLIAIILLLSLIVTRGTDGLGTDVTVPSPVIIGYSNSPSWWPWIIVDDQNLFHKNQVNAELRWYDNYSESVRDLNSGFIDGNSEMLQDALASQNAVKGKVSVLLNAYSDGEDKLIVRDGIEEIEDLQGKTIIAESAATLHNPLLSLVLGSEEISLNDLEVVNLETGSASSAFAVNEEIDGVISFPPYTTVAMSREGARELASSKAFPQKIARMLVFTEDVFDNRPELVEQVLEVWVQALEFMDKNPLRANKIISETVGINDAQIKSDLQQIKIVQRSSLISSEHIRKMNYHHDKL